jgi:membrane protease YdiL (CAAX protease family)
MAFVRFRGRPDLPGKPPKRSMPVAPPFSIDPKSRSLAYCQTHKCGLSGRGWTSEPKEVLGFRQSPSCQNPNPFNNSIDQDLNVPTTRSEFLCFATLFQGSVIAAALGLAWISGVNPFQGAQISVEAVLLAMGYTVPMVILFGITYRFAIGPLRVMKRLLVTSLGPLLDACCWYDLIWVALLAGTSEELMFRGVIQKWLHGSGIGISLLVSNVLFGLCHAVTPTYAVLAGLLGSYLGLAYVLHDNLVIPILMHALYDYIAFLVVRRTFRLEQQAEEVPQPVDSQ